MDRNKTIQVVYGDLRECSCGCGPLAIDMVWFRSEDRAMAFMDGRTIHDPETPVLCRKLSMGEI